MMKLTFFPLICVGDVLTIITILAIALSHPVKAWVKTNQFLTQMQFLTPPPYFIGENSSPNRVDKRCADTLYHHHPREIWVRKFDKPPPIPDFPGGSR
jgi:hypothetical protein